MKRMTVNQSVSCWIDQLKAGDAQAVQPLWERYFVRLVGFARKKLRHTSRAAADEEDVALSAFNSFCQGVEEGRFPKLDDRDDLWRLLVVVTERKAFNQVRDQRRLKRGGGAVQGESALEPSGGSVATPGIGQMPGREPTPDFAAAFAEEFQRLLAQLDEPSLRAVALAKMEGWSNEEVAARHGLALRTVERKLALIRKIWESVATPPI
jgi:DNA-directed RNA polymerase specialized sigma24 family protein